MLVVQRRGRSIMAQIRRLGALARILGAGDVIGTPCGGCAGLAAGACRMKEEFEVLGVPSEDRRRLTDAYLAASCLPEPPPTWLLACRRFTWARWRAVSAATRLRSATARSMTSKWSAAIIRCYWERMLTPSLAVDRLGNAVLLGDCATARQSRTDAFGIAERASSRCKVKAQNQGLAWG